MESPIKMVNLGVPLFLESPRKNKYIYIYKYLEPKWCPLFWIGISALVCTVDIQSVGPVSWVGLVYI